MKIKHFIIGCIIVLIDQFTKTYFLNKNITLIPNIISITYTKNFGGAFSIGVKNIVLVLSILIILGIISFLIFKRDKINNFWPYTFLIFGSFGNLIDRVSKGFVIDFIDINFLNFPIFNIADISIVVGIALIIVNCFKNIENT